MYIMKTILLYICGLFCGVLSFRKNTKIQKLVNSGRVVPMNATIYGFLGTTKIAHDISRTECFDR